MTPDAELSGYAEVRAAFSAGAAGFPLELVERLRPRMEIAPTDRMTAEVVVEASLSQGRDAVDEAAQLLLDSEIRTALDEAGCVYTPADRYSAVSEYLSVERLHLDFNLPAVDLSVGRQAITWGSSLVTHPTDPFPEVLATEYWRERSGVNAFKAEIPIRNHSVTAVVGMGDDLSELYRDEPDAAEIPLTGAVRGTVRAAGTDWSAVAWGRPDGVWLAGLDLRGTVGVGWWVEGGYHGGAESVHDDALPVEVVAGIDYSFPLLERFYVAAEYRYDGTGEDPDNYAWDARTGSFDVPFSGCTFSAGSSEEVAARTSLGRHYVHGILNLMFTQDFSVQAVTLANLQDQTGVLSFDAAANVGSRWQVHLGAQAPYGEEGEYRPPAEVTTVRVGDLSADLSPLLYDVNVLSWARYSF